MGGIQQCVKDVLRIAYETEDFSQARRASSNCSKSPASEAAHQVCPYSRATHGNVAVETTLV
jgi:organic hydroperoxide reductase OsmC/OhrA